MRNEKQGFCARFIKRLLDILLSGLALIVLSPVLLVVAVLVRVKLGSPVLFCQMRPGKGEKIFKMYKFRSMTDARDESGELLPDDVRLTKFGKALRATSLDALPEPLKDAALLRIANPEASLADLATLSYPPVTKSCLSHRLKKIMSFKPEE